jgi:hypothetical protein
VPSIAKATGCAPSARVIVAFRVRLRVLITEIVSAAELATNALSAAAATASGASPTFRLVASGTTVAPAAGASRRQAAAVKVARRRRLMARR